MFSKSRNFKCCSTDNAYDSNGNENQEYPKVVNKQLPPKFLDPIVQNKIVEIPKEVYLEKIIEVPQIKTVERIVEQIKPIYKYKNVYKPKVVYVEKIKNIDKIVYEEKIIEVPQVRTVEKIVDVPVYVDKERIIKVPKYMVVERLIPILKTARNEKVIEVPEVNSPDIDVKKNVETKESINVNDLKENQTTRISEKDVEFLNGINNFKQNMETINVETLQEHSVGSVSQENFCTSLGCKFFPIYPNFLKMAAPVFRTSKGTERHIINSKVYKIKQPGFPKIRIAKTPHTNQRCCYCNLP